MSSSTLLRMIRQPARMLLLAAWPVLAGAGAQAATFFSQGSLEANAPASWNSERLGGGTAPADFASGDVFVVQDADTMALSATWTIAGAGAALELEPGSMLVVTVSETLSVACVVTNAGTLVVQGVLRFAPGGSFAPASTSPPDFAPGSTLVYAGTDSIAVGAEWTGSGAAGPGVPANVRLEGSGVVTLPAGTRGAAGSLVLSSGTLALEASSGMLEVAGDWSVAGGAVFEPHGRPVRLVGAAPQTISAAASPFADLVVDKAAGTVALASDATVGGALDLVSGLVFTGTSALVIGPSGGVTRTNGHVAGRLRKTVPAGTAALTFEVGDSSAYAPVSVAGTGAGFPSAFRLDVSSSAGDPPDVAASGVAAARTANRTFTLADSGYAGGTFDLTCAFAPADLDSAARPAKFVLRRHSGGTWTAATTGARTASSTQATGLAGFGDFLAGEQAIDRYLVQAASPQVVGDTFTTSVSALDVLGEPVPGDSVTSVTLSGDGLVAFDADGNGSFGDSTGTLLGGALAVASRGDSAGTVTLAALDAGSKSGSRPGLVLLRSLAVETAALPNAFVGSAYSETLSAGGGVPPYGGWSVTAGSLPAGLSLQPSTGIVSGTPASVGTQAFTVQVADSVGHVATRPLAITVNVGTAAKLVVVQGPAAGVAGAVLAPALQARITDALGNAVADSGVAVTVALLDGPGPLLGSLVRPTDATGLVAFDDLVVLHAGPAQRLAVTAAGLDSAAGGAFDVGCPALDLSPATLPDGGVGAAYAETLAASGGRPPYVFALVAGALPAGLTLATDGTLTGTPAVAGPAGFTIGVTDSLACTGSRAYTLQVLGAPPAIADLAAVRALSGNDADGTARIAVTFTPPAGADSVEVYRAGFGGYPRYDDAGGSAPAVPGYPPGAPWVRTSVVATGQFDEPATRDFWYYVAFAKNAVGVVSPPSNRTTGTLDYHLGDVSNGVTLGQGDNQVASEDVSLLGANYGIAEPELTTRGVHYLDVGPTTDLLLSSRPFTDGRIDFEDFIVFATNFTAVGAPALAAAPAAGDAGIDDALALEAPAAVEPGALVPARLRLTGSGRVQGFSARLAWDADVVEPVGVSAGDWLSAQDAVVLSSAPGVVDAAQLGVHALGLAGEGEAATVTFRARHAGDPRLRLAQVTARDARNRPVDVTVLERPADGPRTYTTLLAAPWPNPARGSATFAFGLSRAGRLELAIFSVDGRRVRTLAAGPREAGAWRVTWDGTGDDARPLAPGLYYARMQAEGRQFHRPLVLLR